MVELCGNVADLAAELQQKALKYPVENSTKNHKKIIQKVVDLSVLSAYNRDSSLTKMLYKEPKIKIVQKLPKGSSKK